MSFGFQKKIDGFTLLETVVALAILSAAIVGPMSLVSSSIASARASKNLTIASYLAEEGMEIARGIKEDNALAGRAASDGNCAAKDSQWDYGVWDYDICPKLLDSPLIRRANIVSLSIENIGVNDPLRLEAGIPGLYSYNPGGNQTIFTRQVEIVAPSAQEDDSISGLIIPAADILDVTVIVFWRDGFTTRNVLLQERFYNWQ